MVNLASSMVLETALRKQVRSHADMLNTLQRLSPSNHEAKAEECCCPLALHSVSSLACLHNC